MKRFSLFLSLVFILFVSLLVSCGDGNGKGSDAIADSSKYTSASFPDSIQNFGTVVKGKQVQILFHVLNKGSKPLLIADVRPSCGCTVANFTKNAIEPGKEGEITATYDSNHGMPGDVRKTITVTTNSIPTHNMLIFTGTVAAKDSADTK